MAPYKYLQHADLQSIRQEESRQRAFALWDELTEAVLVGDITRFDVVQKPTRGLYWTLHTDPEIPEARNLSTGQMERFLRRLTGR